MLRCPGNVVNGYATRSTNRGRLGWFGYLLDTFHIRLRCVALGSVALAHVSRLGELIVYYLCAMAEKVLTREAVPASAPPCRAGARGPTRAAEAYSRPSPSTWSVRAPGSLPSDRLRY